MTAMRIDPHDTTKNIFNPKDLDDELTKWLHNLNISFIQQTTAINTGIQSLECQEREYSGNAQIIPNNGLCVTHSLVLLYEFFRVYNQPEIQPYFGRQPYGNKVTPHKLEGNELFMTIFNNIYYTKFATPINPHTLTSSSNINDLKDHEIMPCGWTEKYVIAFNQRITNMNMVLLTQLSEAIMPFRKSRSRSGQVEMQMNKAFELHLKQMKVRISEQPTSFCGLDIHDEFYKILQFIIEKYPELNIKSYFTIFGFNFKELITKYQERPPKSSRSSGGNKNKTTKRQNDKTKKTKNKKTKKQKIKKQKTKKNKMTKTK